MQRKKYEPPTIEQLTWFIATLSLEGLSNNTASLYICFIGFQCKIISVKDIPKHYIVSKRIKGMNRPKHSQKVRLPIRLPLNSKFNS